MADSVCALLAIFLLLITQCSSSEMETSRARRNVRKSHQREVVETVVTTTTKVVKRSEVFGYNEHMEKPPPPESVCRRYGYDSEGLYSIKAFTKLLHSLNKAQCDIVQEIVYPADNSLTINSGDRADYIVVGVGVAGSVLASRLSEVATNTVIALEAGGNPSLITEFPRLYAEAADTDYEWGFRLKRDNFSCRGSEFNRCKLYKGKSLGGTSTCDLMLYDRSFASDYEMFNEINALDWNYDACLRYYKKSEDVRYEEMISTSESMRQLHQSGGLLTVDSFYNTQTVTIRKSFSEYVSTIGMTSKEVFTAKDHFGFAPSLAMVKNGLRVNIARAFLSPLEVRMRPNLKISKYSYVTRILLDDSNTKAIGVEFRNRLGNLVTVYCNKEVILTAGAIMSPYALQMSGIGKPCDLERVSLIMRKESLGVGSNLRIHPIFPGLIMTFKNPPIAQWSVGDMLYEFIARRQGPITNIGLSSFTGFIKSKTEAVRPDIQVVPYYFSQDDSLFLNGQLAVFGFDEKIRKKFREINKEAAIIIFALSITYPESVGSVYPATNSPYDPPVIDAKLLSNSKDIYKLLDGIDWVLKFEESALFQKYGGKFVHLYLDNCLYPIGSKDYWIEAIRQLTVARKHPVGTCKMGLPSDPTAVVDPDFKFIGLDNLRIGDSSILRKLFAVDSSAVTVMVAEKVAERIMSLL